MRLVHPVNSDNLIAHLVKKEPMRFEVGQHPAAHVLLDICAQKPPVVQSGVLGALTLRASTRYRVLDVHEDLSRIPQAQPNVLNVQQEKAVSCIRVLVSKRININTLLRV